MSNPSDNKQAPREEFLTLADLPPSPKPSLSQDIDEAFSLQEGHDATFSFQDLDIAGLLAPSSLPCVESKPEQEARTAPDVQAPKGAPIPVVQGAVDARPNPLPAPELAAAPVQPPQPAPAPVAAAEVKDTSMAPAAAAPILPPVAQPQAPVAQESKALLPPVAQAPAAAEVKAPPKAPTPAELLTEAKTLTDPDLIWKHIEQFLRHFIDISVLKERVSLLHSQLKVIKPNSEEAKQTESACALLANAIPELLVRNLLPASEIHALLPPLDAMHLHGVIPKEAAEAAKSEILSLEEYLRREAETARSHKGIQALARALSDMARDKHQPLDVLVSCGLFLQLNAQQRQECANGNALPVLRTTPLGRIMDLYVDQKNDWAAEIVTPSGDLPALEELTLIMRDQPDHLHRFVCCVLMHSTDPDLDVRGLLALPSSPMSVTVISKKMLRCLEGLHAKDCEEHMHLRDFCFFLHCAFGRDVSALEAFVTEAKVSKCTVAAWSDDDVRRGLRAAVDHCGGMDACNKRIRDIVFAQSGPAIHALGVAPAELTKLILDRREQYMGTAAAPAAPKPKGNNKPKRKNADDPPAASLKKSKTETESLADKMQADLHIESKAGAKKKQKTSKKRAKTAPPAEEKKVSKEEEKKTRLRQAPAAQETKEEEKKTRLRQAPAAQETKAEEKKQLPQLSGPATEEKKLAEPVEATAPPDLDALFAFTRPMSEFAVSPSVASSSPSVHSHSVAAMASTMQVLQKKRKPKVSAPITHAERKELRNSPSYAKLVGDKFIEKWTNDLANGRADEDTIASCRGLAEQMLKDLLAEPYRDYKELSPIEDDVIRDLRASEDVA